MARKSGAGIPRRRETPKQRAERVAELTRYRKNTFIENRTAALLALAKATLALATAMDTVADLVGSHLGYDEREFEPGE